MKPKAVGLLSGGLDSTLAVKLMLEQKVEVHALNFVTPFCTCTSTGCRHEASRVAEMFGIEIEVVSGGDDYVQMVRDPEHGYGKNMNPCIDCRIFMLKEAKKYMEKTGASFIFTGEVLGQRPMSQRKHTMKLIEREAGMEGLVVRPLSAHLLEPTIPEREGIVDRNKLLDIQGRRRKPQMELAETYDIQDYPCPAGGCRLTDPQFARRIQEAFDHGEDSLLDVKLLKYGRHFRLPSGAKAIVGREEKENAVLAGWADKGDILLEVVGYGSPTTLLKHARSEADIIMAGSICARYSDCDKPSATVRVKTNSGQRIITVNPFIKGHKLFWVG